MFSSHFFSVIHQNTPSKPSKSTSFPLWFPRSLLHKIRQRCSHYHRALLSNSPSDWQQYHSTINSVLCEIKQAKSFFVHSLSQSPHSFSTYIHSLCKSKSSIPLLSLNSSDFVMYDSDKPNLLNQAFPVSSHQTQLLPQILPHLQSTRLLFPKNHLCSQVNVLQLISALLSTPPRCK